MKLAACLIHKIHFDIRYIVVKKRKGEIILDFECNRTKKCHHDDCKPSVECLKVNSVICSKTVSKVAELTVPAVDIGIPADTDLALVDFTVVPNPSRIVMRGTLVNGVVINSGYVPVAVSIVVAGVELPSITINLPFQEETNCPGACAGDDLQETQPVIEAVLNPVFTPQLSVGGINLAGTVTFKVILRTTITVSREKLVYSAVNVIYDINEDRCGTNVTGVTSPTRTFYGGA